MLFGDAGVVVLDELVACVLMKRNGRWGNVELGMRSLFIFFVMIFF